MADRNVIVRLRADIANFKAGMAEAAASTEKIGKSAGAGALTATTAMGRLGQSITANRAAWDTASTNMLKSGLVMAAGIGFAVSRFADFDQAMSAAAAASQSTGKDLDNLRALAMKMGADTQFSATEAAQGITEMAKAGVSAADILGGGLKGALDLAAAGGMSVARAGEIAATALNQFGLSGKDLPHVADLFAAAAGKAQGSAEDIANAMKYVGPVAKGMGISIEATTGVIAEFASKGIIGEQAGTSLRGMLLSLTAPSMQAGKAMQEVGLNVYDAQGKFVGLEGVAGQLQSRLGTLSEEERNAALGRIFGNEQMAAATVLYQGGAKAVQEWTGKVNDSGFAAEQAAKLTDNLKGDIERLGGSIDTALIQSGSAANGVLRGMAGALEGLVNQFGSLPGPIQGTITGVTVLTAATLLLAGASIKAVLGIQAMKANLIQLGVTAKGVGAALGYASLAVVALGVAFGANALMEYVADANVARVSTDDLVKSLKGLALGAQASGALGEIFAHGAGPFRDNVESMAGAIDQFASSAREALSTNFFESLDRMTGGGSDMAEFTAQVGQLDTALSAMVKAGDAEKAAQAFKKMTDAAVEQNVPLDELTKRFPQYAEAVKAAKAEQDAAKKSSSEYADALDTNKDKLISATEAAEAWKNALEASTDPVFDARDAVNAWEASIDDAKKALKDNGKTVDVHTAKGRANRQMLDTMAKAAQGVINTTKDTTAGQKILHGVLDTSRTRLYNTARSYNMSESDARAYVNQVLKIPKTVSTTVTVSTATATARVHELAVLLAGIKNKSITLTTYTKNALAHGSTTLADGGIITARADGGVDQYGRYVPRIPQVAYGRNIMWAEPETGWEAYISGKPSMRTRNVGILAQTVQRLGLTRRELEMLRPAANGLMVGGGAAGNRDMSRHYQLTVQGGTDPRSAARAAMAEVRWQDALTPSTRG